MTQERLDYKEFPAIEPMIGLEKYVHGCGLEQKLLELVRLRASQINGCAYCIDMHAKDARAAQESEQRLYAVSVWQETPFFTEREQAALAWTEALMLIPQFHVSDALYERVSRQFNEKELVDLTLAIVAINGWNRLAKTFRTVPGTYQPKAGPQEKKQAVRAESSNA
jgi:AhpD family alkylhydroperoxidase